MWAFRLLAIIDFVPLVVYFAFGFGLAVWERQMVSFSFLIVAATHATRTGLFLNWERKQKKHILYEGFLSGRVYASPEIARYSLIHSAHSFSIFDNSELSEQGRERSYQPHHDSSHRSLNDLRAQPQNQKHARAKNSQKE
jgi:hypothetical protein